MMTMLAQARGGIVLLQNLTVAVENQRGFRVKILKWAKIIQGGITLLVM